MNKKNILILTIPFLLISFLSCTNEEEKNQQLESTAVVELPADGLEVENAWARPGSENGVSAIYMTLLNGSTNADSLLAISSHVAGIVELHESYEREEGMMGMRPVKNVVVPARDVLRLEPRGLHVMLMRLNQELVEGNEVELTLEFAKAGEIKVSAPVQSMQ